MAGRGSIRMTVQSPDAKAVSRGFSSGARAVPTATRRRVTSAGEIMRNAVRTETSWSQRIPRAVRVSAASTSRRTTTLAVTIDRSIAPEASALNNRDKAGTFTRPVWGHRDRLVQQTARPFMAKSEARARARVNATLDKIGDDVTHAAGFK